MRILSVNSLTRLSTLIDPQQEDVFTARPRGENHSFTRAESHLSRRKIGNADDESALELVDLIGCFNSGKYRLSLVATKAQLAAIVEAGPDAVADAFPGWRYDFVGRDLEGLLRGTVAVRLDAGDGWPVAG